jgi:hypothetical protein
MPDLDHNTNGELAKLAAEREAKRNALQDTLTAQKPPEVPENTSSQTTATAETPPAPPEAVLPVAGDPPAPKPEEPKTEEPITAPVEELIKAWDEDEAVAVADTDLKFDAKKLGSALGLEVKDEDELVKTVTEKLAKFKQLESEKDTAFQGIPDSLKDAIEVAKKGGDWQTLVGSNVDVANLDPVDLFDHEYKRRNAHKFKLADGSIDEEALEKALDAIPVELAEFQGDAIKQQLIQVQHQKKMQIIAQAEKQQAEFSKKLSEAATNISKTLPKESFGITFEPKHSEFLYNGIANQSLIKKHLGDI